jgi:hypothetical protein
VGVSAPERLSILKLLHWYLLGFAKDVVRAVDEGQHQAHSDAALQV